MHPVVLADLTQLSSALNQIFGQIRDLIKGVSPYLMGISVLMVGLMYISASIPGLKTFKEENPRAVSSIMWGFFILMCASAVTTGLTIS